MSPPPNIDAPSEGHPTPPRSRDDHLLARHARLALHLFDSLLWADQMLGDDELVEALDEALDRLIDRVAELEAAGATVRPDCWEARVLSDLRGEAA